MSPDSQSGSNPSTTSCDADHAASRKDRERRRLRAIQKSSRRLAIANGAGPSKGHSRTLAQARHPCLAAAPAHFTGRSRRPARSASWDEPLARMCSALRAGRIRLWTKGSASHCRGRAVCKCPGSTRRGSHGRAGSVAFWRSACSLARWPGGIEFDDVEPAQGRDRRTGADPVRGRLQTSWRRLRSVAVPAALQHGRCRYRVACRIAGGCCSTSHGSRRFCSAPSSPRRMRLPCSPRFGKPGCAAGSPELSRRSPAATTRWRSRSRLA